MKSTTNVILATIFVVVAMTLVSGCGSKQTGAKEEQKPVPVSVMKVKKGNIFNNTVVTGKITANSEVMIIPKIGGKVSQVTVDVGSRVKAGDLLVQLDTSELNAQLKQAQGLLENAKEGAAQYNYRLEDATKNLRKMQQLYSEGAISKDQYDSALLQYNILVNSTPGPQVQQAQGNVDYIRAQIANATMTAPISGQVSAKTIEVGELAGPSAPVLTIVDTSKVLVEGTITEKDIPFVNLGQKVKVEIDTLGATFDGVIASLSPAADPKTKGYQVKVEIENPEGKVKPGMFAEISITTQSKDGIPLIPKEAVVTRGEKKVVYVVQNDTVVEQEVTTGMEDEKNVEIIKGLSEGDTVVTVGQNSLSDKTKVVIKD